jgi:P27 family predicted phage terminase small subunit
MKSETNKIEPPSFLTNRALEIWHEIEHEIQNVSAAVQIEAIALAALCESLADLEAADAAILEFGIIHKTERGMTKNPALSIKNQALSHIYRFSKEFGFTPRSRSRVSFSRTQNESNIR